MKKKTRITILLTTLLLLFAFAMPASAASKKTKAIKAYKTFLSQKTLTISNSDGSVAFPTAKMKFALVYLDNDTIPELIIDNTPNYTGNYYPWGYAVFTYKSGKVKQLYCQNTNYKIKSYYKKKSVLCFDGVVSFYGRLKGTKLTILAAKNGSKYYKGDSFFTENPKKITKSKFNSLLKKYVGSTKAAKITYRKNTSANRKKYLK